LTVSQPGRSTTAAIKANGATGFIRWVLRGGPL
jgi:hypothetical protein